MTFIIVAGVLLGGVLTHEIGHLLASKRYGVKVYEMSVGLPIGPVVWRIWRHRETSFVLRLIPLGGYCRYSRTNRKPWEKFRRLPFRTMAIITTAGSVANFVVGSVAIEWYLFLYRDMSISDAVMRALGIVMGILASAPPAYAADTYAGPLLFITTLAPMVVMPGTWLLLFGVVNIAIGAFNLLPVPPLDGGVFLIRVFEHMTGKRLAMHTWSRIMQYGNMVAASTMGALMVWDIIRIIR